MTNFNFMLKQAQQLQTQMLEMQGKLEQIEITGSAGGGMVSVTLNGKNNLLKVVIDKKLMNPDDSDIVSDLIVAAFNDAKKKLETKISEEMSSVTEKFGLPPGFKMPFGV